MDCRKRGGVLAEGGLGRGRGRYCHDYYHKPGFPVAPGRLASLAAATDHSYYDQDWAVPVMGRIRLTWTLHGDVAMGLVRVEKPCRVALHVTPSWLEFPPSDIVPEKDGIVGQAEGTNHRWSLKADRPAVACIAAETTRRWRHRSSPAWHRPLRRGNPSGTRF